MICTRFGLAALVFAMLLCSAAAQEYTIEPLKENPPTEGLTKEIVALLADNGVRINQGSAGPFCDIWLRKEWPVKADFKSTPEIQFPFQFGEFIGLIRYHKKGLDFRGQDAKPGVYSLRFGLQPVDGNHVGTSDTRDFLLLVRPEDDTSVQPIEEKVLFRVSAKAAGSTHPAMLYLRKPADAAGAPVLKHNEEAERWSVVMAGTPKGGKAGSLALELTVVGMAKE